MEQEQPYGYDTVTLQDPNDDMPLDYNAEREADGIRLPSPESLAFNGLLSDLEFTLTSWIHMLDYYGSILDNGRGTKDVSLGYARTAYGVYSNKIEELEAVVNKWKPNKK